VSRLDAHPHGGQAVLRRGPEPPDARLTMILIHGRGASAEEILTLADDLGTRDVAYLAPQAAGHTWYPYSFLVPTERNEPGLGSALRVVSDLIGQLEGGKVPASRIVLAGFSQGACLALEFAARHARRYGGVAALSGALIGPPATARTYTGKFDGMPLFLGCSDIDPHIPLERVRESAEVFRRMGAAVDERIYRGMGHTVNRDELDAVRALIAAASA
jgi:predicted esterase